MITSGPEVGIISVGVMNRYWGTGVAILPSPDPRRSDVAQMVSFTSRQGLQSPSKSVTLRPKWRNHHLPVLDELAISCGQRELMVQAYSIMGPATLTLPFPHTHSVSIGSLGSSHMAWLLGMFV